ncbi:MAG: hypothetical protein ABR884_00760 [Minisyncoccia bacterium]|jgi:hypothetical protein
MEPFSLFDYLKKNTEIDKSKLDLLKSELDRRIYFYGEHFKYPKERSGWGKSMKSRAKDLSKDIYAGFFLSKGGKKTNKKNILSNAYFSVNDELAKQNFNVLRPMHKPLPGEYSIAGNLGVYKNFLKINHYIRESDFKYLISEEFFAQLDSFIDQLTDYYRSMNMTSLIVYNDTLFFDLINIEIFKRLKKPSFIFSHGLPGRYNIYDENKTDYLVVWGKKIKENYVHVGFDPDKILISGHPFYKELPDAKLRNNLDNILVLSKPLDVAQSKDKVRLSDRGNSIVYLYSIEKILKSLGVRSVRLRIHPQDDINWYYKFINRDFFAIDRDPLRISLGRSTLVIGPTSTVFLEAIYYGVNYLVYEPTVAGLDLSGYSLVPPFDGSDNKVPTANDEGSLKLLLKGKALVDRTIFNDYIDTPFNIRVITDRI